MPVVQRFELSQIDEKHREVAAPARAFHRPGQAFEDALPIQEPGQAVANDRDFQLRIPGGQGLLRLHQLSDVLVCAEQPGRTTQLVPYRQAATAHPHRRTVSVPVSDDLIVGVIRILYMFGEIIQDRRQILGEDVVLPPIRGIGNLIIAIAEQLFEPGAQPLMLLIVEVPVPDSVEGSSLEELEDLVAFSDPLV